MKLSFRTRVVLLILLVALLIGLISFADAKYAKKIIHTGSVTISARLAESMELLEHKVERQPDGSYMLDTSKTVDANTYELIPGVDIPKDPFITIKNKTDIGAYLFVEVVGGQNVGTEEDARIRYQMTDDWQLLSDVTGKHNGTVYAYTGGGTVPAVLDSTLTRDCENQTKTIKLLNKDTIEVSQYLITGEPGNDHILTFHVSMKEVAVENLAANVYKR